MPRQPPRITRRRVRRGRHADIVSDDQPDGGSSASLRTCGPAHIVTLLRIPLAVAIAWMYGNTWWVVGLIAAAATSDAIDGNLARWLKRRGKKTPDIGGWLDPLADKVFVAAIALHTHSLEIVALIGARELVLLPLLAIYLARRRPHPQLHADWFGKVATIAQFFALAIAVAEPAHALPGAIVAAVLGVVAAAHYAIVHRRE